VLELTFVDTPGEVCDTTDPAQMSADWSVSGLSVLMDVITVTRRSSPAWARISLAGRHYS